MLPNGSYLSAQSKSKAATFADGFSDGVISAEGLDDLLAAALWEQSLALVGAA